MLFEYLDLPIKGKKTFMDLLSNTFFASNTLLQTTQTNDNQFIKKFLIVFKQNE